MSPGAIYLNPHSEELAMSDHTLTCYVECPSPAVIQFKGDLHADFLAGGADPVNIIRCDQAATVRVRIDFTGRELARLLCLDWCIKVAFESCGPAPETALPVVRRSQQVCREPFIEVNIPIPARYFPCDPAQCGNVYELCVTAVSFDMCGNPAPFAGYCRGGTIMVFPESRPTP